MSEFPELCNADLLYLDKISQALGQMTRKDMNPGLENLHRQFASVKSLCEEVHILFRSSAIGLKPALDNSPNFFGL